MPQRRPHSAADRSMVQESFASVKFPRVQTRVPSGRFGGLNPRTRGYGIHASAQSFSGILPGSLGGSSFDTQTRSPSIRSFDVQHRSPLARRPPPTPRPSILGPNVPSFGNDPSRFNAGPVTAASVSASGPLALTGLLPSVVRSRGAPRRSLVVQNRSLRSHRLKFDDCLDSSPLPCPAGSDGIHATAGDLSRSSMPACLPAATRVHPVRRASCPIVGDGIHAVAVIGYRR